MKLAHTIKLSVFVNEGEEEAQILERMKSFLPLDFDIEKITIQRQKATGLKENKIIILTLNLEKEKHTNVFIETLINNLNQKQREILLREAQSRLDNELNFYIRIDKKKLMEENKFYITDSGNCFHIKIHIAAFPKKREKALEVIRRFLNKEF
ncbi:MAG: RNA-binding domain-containing protein [Candidatus Woesearchaeota archaeon]